jgi:hypothetical protein
MRALLLLAGGLTLGPIAVAAQTRHLSPASSALFEAAAHGPLHPGAARASEDSVRRVIVPTYWKEGAAVGAAVGAVGGFFLGRFICEVGEKSSLGCGGTTALAVVGTALFLAIPGALIGGQFSKD